MPSTTPGSVSYPASQNGGSVSYSGTAYEDVTVNIDVATEPFEHSVARCNNHVGTLTGAVVATEAAQIASIRENAREGGADDHRRLLQDGAFRNQPADLRVVEPDQCHAGAPAGTGQTGVWTSSGRWRSTTTGFSTRYLKIFDELNSELKNRIFELDRPAFVFKADSDESAARFVEGPLVGIGNRVGQRGEFAAGADLGVAEQEAGAGYDP